MLTPVEYTPAKFGGKKRQLSSGTPSPSVSRSAKSSKMDTSTPPQNNGTNLDKNYFKKPYLGINLEDINEITEDREKWDMVINAFQTMASKFEALEKENTDLKNLVQTNKGKIVRLEHDLHRAKKHILDLEWCGLQSNVVIYNCPERKGEDCKSLDLDKFEKELQIPLEQICTTKNPKGLIEIDVAYRIGKPTGKPRPIVIKLTNMSGKYHLMSIYAKSKGLSNLRLADRYPPEMRERRNAQINDLKHLQNLYKDSDTKVQLIKDNLKIGNQITRETFEKNKLQSSPQASVPK